MTNPKLIALAATAGLALGAAAPATSMARAERPGTYVVAKQVYIREEAGKIFTGTLLKGWTFKVERLSPSGKYAYGMAYGHVNRHGWVESSALGLKK